MLSARTLSMFAVLYALWLLLSGIWEPFLLVAGAVSCLLVTVIAHRMDVIDGEGHPIHLTWRAMVYFPWLAWQIALSNLVVARAILQPGRLVLNTACGPVPAGQVTDVGLVTFANSITLTPGTVSLVVASGEIYVHALDRRGYDDLIAGEMNRRVCQMEGHA